MSWRGRKKYGFKRYHDNDGEPSSSSKREHSESPRGREERSRDESAPSHWERRPPGLRGREIGLWYARRNKLKANRTEGEQLDADARRKAYRDAKNMELEKKSLANIFLSKATKKMIDQFLDETSENYCTMRRQNSYEHLQESEFKHNFLRHINSDLDSKLEKAHDDMFPPRNEALDQRLYADFMEKQSNEKYNVMQEIRKRLPSMKMREEILELIENNQVVVISGETGCGKTTQVSQFILDHYIQNKKGSLCRVICTQPRRISAISVAERVTQERAEKLGNSVGYQIRLEKSLPRDQGSILFCTTGVLVKFMESNLLLEGVSHIILDEIHERDVISDFLITLLKDVITVRKDLRVILMSATLNSDAFSKYYNNAPHLNIPGFTYPVQEYFLEDILEKTRFSFSVKRFYRKNVEIKRNAKERQDYIEPWVRQLESEKKFHARVILELMKPESEMFNTDFVFEVLKYVCEHDKDDGAILVFVTGFADIQAIMRNISFSKGCFPYSKYLIIPLHSQLDTVNQKQIFQPAPPGKRKIIISTNIAETSITIEDVTTVINCGFIKMTNLHEEFGYETLNAEFVSKANAGQRRGRAGRVKPGVCYHLISRGRYNILEEFQKPEILRRRLEDVVLSVKMLQLGMAGPFLSKLMDSPDPESVRSSIALLERLGALDEEEKLTPLGYHMANLPVGAHPAKMLILACIFSCLDPVLSIAATIGFKEPFQISSENPEEADKARWELSNNCKSDHILMHLAIKGFEKAQHNKWEQAYCRKYFLSSYTLKLLTDMRRQFAEQLYDMKFVKSKNPKEPCHNMNSENWSLIKAIICAGLYPNVFICNPKRKQNLRSVNHERMTFHPKCLLSREMNEAFDSLLGVYHLRLKTKSLSVHDATLVHAYPLIFFGDNYRIKTEFQTQMVTINEGKMAFKCKTDAAETIRRMRVRLNQILEHMIGHPGSIDWSKNSIEVKFLRILMELITSEDLDEWNLSDFDSDSDSKFSSNVNVIHVNNESDSE